MSEIRATTISDAAGTGPVTLTKQSAAKAWINFNGSGTVATRNSFNTSSLTDLGTGRYRITYTNSMSGNYSTTSSGNTGAPNIYGGEDIAASFGTYVTNYSGTLSDIANILYTVQGDLA